MCGITGFVGLPSDARIKAMTRSLAHRGPDDEGTYVRQTPHGVVALGQRRLSIIDLEGGSQPLFSQDGRIALIANGEIYNHELLRRGLERRGHQLKTRSDSEVILHLYEELGTDLFEKLDGMYAFALWDDREKVLLLGRDPIGKKPLYVQEEDGGLLFASEPKAIAESKRLTQKINPEALNLYLRFGYTPSPLTFYQGLESLPPGSWLRWQGGKITRGRHFQLEDWIDPDAHRLDFAGAVARTKTLLSEAVEKRLVADVPVGVFLSGGVDSSLVAAFAARASGEGLRTFTVGHGGADRSYDERDTARAISRHIGSDHTEILIEPAIDGMLDRMVETFDEPFADSSSIPTYLISQATSHAAKVVLSGVGGDEAFAGYPRHLGLAWSLAADRLPAWMRRQASRWLTPRIRESNDIFNFGGRARRFLATTTLSPQERYLSWVTLFDEDARRELLGTAAQVDGSSPSSAACTAKNPMDFAFRHDTQAYLSEDLLRVVDRSSMAHGLEVRAPFCDPALMGFALGLRARIKLGAGFTMKAVLKEAARGMVPPHVLNGPKRGFMVPVGRWLQNELRPVAERLLSERACREGGILNPRPVAELWRAHLANEANHSHKLWALLMLQAWRQVNSAAELKS